MARTKPAVREAAPFLCDKEFRGLCSAWRRQGRCPLGLVDWLLERGYAAEAEGARWAYRQKDRPLYADARYPAGPSGGVYPFRDSYEKKMWFWSHRWLYQSYLIRCDLPVRVFRKLKEDLNWWSATTGSVRDNKYYASFAEAVAAFLAAYAEAGSGKTSR